MNVLYLQTGAVAISADLLILSRDCFPSSRNRGSVAKARGFLIVARRTIVSASIYPTEYKNAPDVK